MHSGSSTEAATASESREKRILIFAALLPEPVQGNSKEELDISLEMCRWTQILIFSL